MKQCRGKTASSSQKGLRKLLEVQNRCSLEKPTCSRCRATVRFCEYSAPVLDSTPEMPIRIPYDSPTGGLPYLRKHFQRGVVSSSNEKEELDFSTAHLVPNPNAENIRHRWLKPYIVTPAGHDETPKVYHPSTIQYISQTLSTYPRHMLSDEEVPPVIHSAQIRGENIPVALANCYSLVRMWERIVPGSEGLVVNTLAKEMNRLAEEVPHHSNC
jgi:hypothetical protein